MDVTGLVHYCKTHRVVRVAIIYLPIAWVLLRVALIAQPGLDAPEWVPKVLAFALLAGYPIALIVSWAMDIEECEKKQQASPASNLELPGGVRHQPQDQLTSRSFGVLVVFGMLVLFGGLYLSYSIDFSEEESTDAVAQTTTVAEETPPWSEKSIAVLPFLNLSPDPEQQSFCDGMSEELLNLLTQVGGLDVAARTSSFALRDTKDDLPTIGEQLNVAHVVEGSVRRDGDDIRVTAQLIRTDTGYHVWSDNFDATLTNIIDVQEEIAEQVVKALVTRLGAKAGFSAVPAIARTDPEAYDAYLRGRGVLWQSRPDRLEAASAHFEDSLSINPNYSPAEAGYVFAQTLLGLRDGHDSAARTDLYARALQLVEEDPGNSMAAAAAAMHGMSFYRWSEVEEVLQFALGADINNAGLTTLYATLLAIVGSSADASGELLRLSEQGVDSPAAAYLQALIEGPESLERAFGQSTRAWDWGGYEVISPASDGDAENRYVDCRVAIERGGARQAKDNSNCRTLRGYEIALLASTGASQEALDLLLERARKAEFDARLILLPEVKALDDDPRFSEVATALNLDYLLDYGGT